VAPGHLVDALAAAQQYDVPISIHVAETQTEVTEVLTRYGNRPVQHLEAIGFLQPRIIAAHMVWPNAQEIALLAQRGVGVIHNPTSNLKLASGFSPVPQLLAAGVKVGLGTDGSEACGLVLSQVDMDSRVLHVRRLKDGLSTTHPLRGDEIRAIKAWLADRARMKPDTDAFFLSERRRPLSRKTAWLMIRAYGERAGLPLLAYPHMLRHACGFALADQGADTRLIQDYLGHRNIQHTVRHTATNPARFERLWKV
jgi:type 1 fimbriae regulatory protein FimB